MNGESIRMSIKNTINMRDNDFGSISNLAFSGKNNFLYIYSILI